MSYPITNPNSVPAQDTGRILFIDDATAITPRKLLKYAEEGFAPVARTESSGTISFAFASYGEDDGVYTLTIGEDSYTSSDIDTAFAAS